MCERPPKWRPGPSAVRSTSRSTSFADRLSELPKNKEILAFCQVGLRGYVACRILTQNGFACRNLSGGYKTFRMAVPAGTTPPGRNRRPELKDDAGTQGPEKQPGPEPVAVVKHIDACGLQCPGPILRLKQELAGLQAGQALTIAARDPGFAADIPAWCHSTGNELAQMTSDKGTVHRNRRQAAGRLPRVATGGGKRQDDHRLQQRLRPRDGRVRHRQRRRGDGLAGHDVLYILGTQCIA